MHIRRPLVALTTATLALTGLGPTAHSAPSPTTPGSSTPDPAAQQTGQRPPAANGCRAVRPYSPSSPWNRPIKKRVATLPQSAAWVQRLQQLDKPLTSDVDQYTISLRCTDRHTPRVSVTFSGLFGDYSTGVRVEHGTAPTIENLPIPADVSITPGTDGQLVIWDQARGLEYGFWKFHRTEHGYQATNGYIIRTDRTGQGSFLDGKAGRGAGTPYLAGLVTPDEIARGRIDHALAFAYHYPSHTFVWPATKTDGLGDPVLDMPEGTRLQLDPRLTESDFKKMRPSPAAVVVAKALQRYRM